MDVYVISPVSNLEPMRLGQRIFVLAHLWVQFPAYRLFIKKLIEEDPRRWITLDNSAAERALVTEDVLIDVCHELIPHEVIAPDVLYNKEETIRNAIAFRNRMEKEGLFGKVDIFFCPQGDTKADWLEAYEWGINQDWIDVIGLSKIAVPHAWLPNQGEDQGIKEARHRCYDYLKENELLKKPIHCLGQGSYMEFAYYTHPMMISTDSVYPVPAAVHGIDFRIDFETRIPTPHNFLETFDMAGVDMALVESNVRKLKESCTKRD